MIICRKLARHCSACKRKHPEMQYHRHPYCNGQDGRQLISLTLRGKVGAQGAASLELRWNYCPCQE